jgi:hypothetical protein
MRDNTTAGTIKLPGLLSHHMWLELQRLFGVVLSDTSHKIMKIIPEMLTTSSQQLEPLEILMILYRDHKQKLANLRG